MQTWRNPVFRDQDMTNRIAVCGVKWSVVTSNDCSDKDLIVDLDTFAMACWVQL